MTEIAGSGFKEAWIRGSGSGSVPKRHGSGTLFRKKIGLYFRGYLYLILEDEERVHDLLGKY
jgi:hypothetical protein